MVRDLEIPQTLSCRLSYQEGNSDKVYELDLRPDTIGWCVNFGYGRRGAQLQRGFKCLNQSYAYALQCYDKYRTEKLNKGYQMETEGPSIVPQETAVLERVTPKAKHLEHVIPKQKHKIIDLKQRLDTMLTSSLWWMQELHEAPVRTITKTGDTITISRGQDKPPEAALKELKQYRSDFQILGVVTEWSTRLHMLDLLSFDGHDLRAEPYQKRFQWLSGIERVDDLLRPVECAKTPEEKRAFFKVLKEDKAWGIVFKSKDEPFSETPNWAFHHFREKNED